MKKTTIIIMIILITSILIGIYFYPQMPDRIASHWNSKGEVDDYMSKFWGLFLFPAIIKLMLWMYLLIPKIDPLKKNIQKFRKHFDGMIIMFALFLFYIYILVIIWNLGHEFDMESYMLPALGLLFFYIGIVVEHAKRNWFIGIRTPWTLSSDNIWNKTHKLGGKLFKISGVIAFLGILFNEFAIWLGIGPIILSVLYLFLYSYFEFKKENK
ncbi:MAG: DUF1648 domain-containing protein [archaeon]